MNARAEVEREFQEFMAKVFPNVSRGSTQYVCLRTAFLGGMFSAVHALAAPDKSVNHGLAIAAAIDRLMAEDVAGVMTRDAPRG